MLREAQRLKGENDALKATEEIRYRAEASRLEAQQIAKIGVWEYDPQNGRTWWSEGMYALFELDKDESPPSWDDYIQIIHEEDRLPFQKALSDVLKTGEACQIDARIRTHSHTIKWIHCHAGISYSAPGSTARLIGNVHDISSRKQAEIEQSGRNAVLESLANQDTLPHIFELIMDMIEQVFPHMMVAFLEFRESVEKLFPAISRNLHEDLLSTLTNGWPAGPEDEGLCVEAIYSGKQTVVPDLQASNLPASLKERFRLWAIHSCCIIPIKKASNKVLGTFICYFPKKRTPTAAEMRLMQTAAYLTEIAIEGKQAEEQLKENALHRDSLLRLRRQLEVAKNYEQVIDAIHPEVQHVLGYNTCWLYLFSQDRKSLCLIATRGRDARSELGHLQTIDTEQDAYAKALTEVHDIWVIPDVRTHPLTNKETVLRTGNRVVVNMPIRILDKSLGVIGAGTFWEEDPIIPTESQENFWRQMAYHTGSALDRIQFVDELYQTQQKLQKAKESLEQTVIKRTEELAELELSMKHFVYLASHDLQEPLRMVVSYIQLLNRRAKDKMDDSELEFMDFAIDGAMRMKELLDGILAYSRLTTQAQEQQLVDLNEVMDSVQQSMKATLAQRDGNIEVSSLPTIKAEPRQMLQLFRHLIDNAIKFHGDRPPQIEVGATQTEDGFQFFVRDRGIGFEEKDKLRIFNMFQRLHARSQVSGNGVGLALSARIVHLHQGKIWAESIPHEGSTFYFTLKSE